MLAKTHLALFTLLLILAVPCSAEEANEIEIDFMNGVYTDLDSNIQPVQRGALTIHISSPEHQLTVHGNRLRLGANDDGTVHATLEVDFLGQCASESLGTEYWSSSGGQVDYTRGVLFSEDGQSFIVLHSTPHDESASRIVAELRPGAAVTTYKNIVDKVVTEHGVAELRGASIADRTRRLIAIAHPKFRDELGREAREIGYL